MSETITPYKHGEWRREILSQARPFFGWKKSPIWVSHPLKCRLRKGERYCVDALHPPDWVLADAIAGRSKPIAKAYPDDCPDGRWITVHPNGPDEDGHPVYICPNHDGSYTVTRGVGGALNGLRLTNVKSPEEYKRLARDRARAKKEERNERESALRVKLGDEEYQKLQDEKQHRKEQAKAEREKAEWDFIRTVAQAQGVDIAQFEIPDDKLEGLSPKLASRLKDRARKAALTWASRVTDNVKKVVETAYEEVAASALGDLTATDISGTSTGDRGRGYRASVSEIAADQGLTRPLTDEVKHDVSWRRFMEQSDMNVEAASQKMLAAMERTAARQASAAEVRQAARELAETTGLGPDAIKQLDDVPKVEVLGDAVNVLLAAKKLDKARKEEKEFNRHLERVDDVVKLPKAAVVISSEMTDEDAMDAVAKTLSEDAMQRAMHRLINVSNDLEKEHGSFHEHYSVGRNAAFNDVTGALSDTTVDPLVHDILGTSAMAHALVAHWKDTMTPDAVANLRDVLVEHHIDTQVAISEKAVTLAEEYLERAASFPISEISEFDDVEAALVAHAERMELVRKARQEVGVARGRLEAIAALNDALMKSGDDNVLVSLGKVSTEDAMEQAYAVGLEEHSVYDPYTTHLIEEKDFTIDSDGGNRILTIHPQGLRKIVRHSHDPDFHARIVQSTAIKNGHEDDPDWLPDGITRRPITRFDVDDLEFRSVDTALHISEADTQKDIEEKLRLHIGSRINSGQDPFDVQQDLWSASFIAGLGLDDSQLAKYQAALNNVAPYHVRKWGEKIDDEEFQKHLGEVRAQMEKYADEHIEHMQKHGHLSDEDAALDKQRINMDEISQDCLYQAVLIDPRTRFALDKTEELDREGREAIRRYAFEHLFGIDPQSDEIITPLTPDERRVYDKWCELKDTSVDPYAAIQHRMIDDANNDLNLLFEPAPPPPVATVDLSNVVDLVRFGKEHGNLIGYAPIIHPDGSREYPEAEPGRSWQKTVDGQQIVDVSPRTEAEIASDVRRRIKDKLRSYFVEHMAHAPDLAESGFNPEKVETASDRWTQYCHDIGGEARAYQVVQEFMVGDVVQRFASIYRQRTGKVFKIASRPVSAAQAHAEALLAPEKRAKMLSHTRSEQAKLQQGKHGKFVPGSVKERLEAQQMAESQSARLFGASETSRHVNVMRASLGKSVEKSLRAMLPYCDVNTPVSVAGDIRLAGPTINRQRAIRLILANQRQGLNLGTGAGKTLCMIGALTHLRNNNKVRRALIVVPSNIVAQFGGEFAKFVDPSSGLRWFSDPSAKSDDRKSAYANTNFHAVVVTPEALREDITNAIADEWSVSKEEAVSRLEEMSDDERDRAIQDVMSKRGWDFDMSMFDESHRLLGRKGKPDAHMARIANSIGRHTPYYVYSTADPVKNDASEAWHVLNMIDPKRYPPEGRDAFMRKYMRNTAAAGRALQRELEPYLYVANVDTGVRHNRSSHYIPLTEQQQMEYDTVESMIQRARNAHALGKVDVEAIQHLSPHAFEDVPEDRHYEIASKLQANIAGVAQAARNRVVNCHPQGAKIDFISSYASKHKTEPILIFAHNLDAVDAIYERLHADGHKVARLKGNMPSDAKARVQFAFSPPSGEPSIDILVASDAAAMGANLQRAAHLINVDSPMTAMLHEQRIARAVRTGQLNNVQVHDLICECPYDHGARRILEKKGKFRKLVIGERLDDSGLADKIRARRIREATVNVRPKRKRREG